MNRSVPPSRLVPLLALAFVNGCASTADAPGRDEGSGARPIAVVADAGPEAGDASADGADTRRPLGRVTPRPELLVATDLVNALGQIEQFAPEGTVVRMPRPTTAFAEALESALVAGGFAVERVGQRTGTGVLMSSMFPSSEPGAPHDSVVIVAIDRVALKRTYVMHDGFVAPTSSLFVRGAAPDSIVLNDALFASSVEASP